jgi:isoquinoline 1-oxidoreductase beta subunit
METLIELATRARMDPFAHRRKLLKPEAKKPLRVLDLFEQASASWRGSIPRGHALGISSHESFGTGLACAVDVSIENKRPRIHRATVVVDCGLAVNPLAVESQFQAGLAFSVSQLMAKGAITLKNGRVEQRNFDGYAPPYIMDAPVAVDVHMVESGSADGLRGAAGSGDLAGSSERAGAIDRQTLSYATVGEYLIRGAGGFLAR